MPIMNFINPRERLPKPDDLFWAVFVDDKAGMHPCAKLGICIASLDRYGVLYGEEINSSGYPSYIRHFFAWRHFYRRDIEKGSDEYCTRDNWNESDMITAWLPYDGLPEWDYIDVLESQSIIKDMQSYQDESVQTELKKL